MVKSLIKISNLNLEAFIIIAVNPATFKSDQSNNKSTFVQNYEEPSSLSLEGKQILESSVVYINR